MDALLGWLSGVPLGGLYALIFLASLIEGVIPLMPGDVAAALLAFYAARSGGLLVPTIVAVTGGSVLGAIVMWWIGRRFGAEWVAKRIAKLKFAGGEEKIEAAEHRVEDAYKQYGWVALFVSRFLPGIRAVVPAVAGALRVPFWEIAVIFTVASGLWYGVISWIAFRVGEDWATVRATLEVVARDVGLGAVVAALVLVFFGWRIWKKRRAVKMSPKAEPPQGPTL
jgi:membrane protein DedA with SNARE-associated domain